MTSVSRRDVMKGMGLLGVSTLAGCAGRGAVHSDPEMIVDVEVVDVERYEEAIEVTIEVENETEIQDSIGLHVHYWYDGFVHHSHMPTVHLKAGERKQIRDTFDHDPDEVDRVTAHKH